MIRSFVRLLFLMVILSLNPASHAAITYWGGVADDVNLLGSDPNTWDATTIGYVGFSAAGGDGGIEVTPIDTLLSNTVYMGYNPGVSGEVTLDGSGADWENASRIYVGEFGDGTLDILNGAALNSGSSVYIGSQSGSTGSLLVDNSSLDTTNTTGILVAGDYGTGDLTIQNGGTAVSYKGRVGYHVGSNGTVTVNGSGSSWDSSSDFMVGTYGTGELTISAGAQVSDYKATIGYSNATGTVTVTGSGSQWNHTGTTAEDDRFNIARGDNTTGSLYVVDGGMVTTLAGTRIANSSTATGTVEIDGGTWTESDYVHVASYGTCTFSITNGGVFNNNWAAVGRYSGSDATITVTGAGSEWNTSTKLYIGRDGAASMTIGSGGLVTSGGGARIGYDGSSDGEIVVDGGTLQNSADYIMIGTLGSSTGSLEVKNGGQVVNAVRGILGYDESASGTATVTGAGSQWSNYDLRVGQNAAGELTVSNGGTVYALNHIHIGQSSYGSGTVTVTGSGSSMETDGRIMVGNSGVGVLNINDSATVTALDTYVDEDQSGTSSGTINFSNGALNTNTLFADVNSDLTGTGTVNANGLVANVALTFSNPSDLTDTLAVGVGGNVTLNLDAGAAIPYAMGAGYNGTGSLTLSNGVELTSNDGQIAYQSTATGTATVTGSGTIWNLEDDLVVGRYGAATLEIDAGGRVSVNDVLTIDQDVVDAVAGAVADSYINMADGAMLAVLLEEGESPDLATMINGDLDHLRWWNDSLSNWDSINNATAGTDYTLVTQTVGESDYALLTVGGRPGDFDGDGDVDVADLMQWQRNGGSSADLTAWQDSFTGGPLAGGITSVPEPASAALLLIAALFACGRRRG